MTTFLVLFGSSALLVFGFTSMLAKLAEYMSKSLRGLAVNYLVVLEIFCMATGLTGILYLLLL